MVSEEAWCYEICHLLEIPFSKVQYLPMLFITGFPADCKPREARGLVLLLPGYKGHTIQFPRGMLVLYTWWQTDSTAANAMMRLRGMRMDTACSACLDVVKHSKWPISKNPSSITI